MKKIPYLFLTLLVCVGIFNAQELHDVQILEDNLTPPATFEMEDDVPNIVEKVTFPHHLKSIYDLKQSYLISQSNLLEVNIPDRKIRVYERGVLIKEADMAAFGNKQAWGGTPVGAYLLSQKINLAFSYSANAYMPYAIKLYGKFYLHGMPYYPDGTPIVSYYSGGCIRVKDTEIKEIFKMVDFNWPILIIDNFLDDYRYEEFDDMEILPQISADKFLIGDIDSLSVLASKNEEQQAPIASITKLMSSLVVVENVDLKRMVWVDSDMLEEGYGNTIGIKAGDKFRLYELLYPTLIESSNDAASVLGGYLGKRKTVDEMNEKAMSILMEKTKYVDTHGFSPENISTPKDLFYLAEYIYKISPLLLGITKGDRVRIYGDLQFKIDELKNKNIYYEDENFLGGKVGYIHESKNTGIFIFDMKFDKKRFEKDYIKKENAKDILNTEVTWEETEEKEIIIPELRDSRKIAIILLGSDSIKQDVKVIKKYLSDNYYLIDNISEE